MIDLKMPDSIVSVTTKQAQQVLGVSRSTMGDYKVLLNYERPKGWDFQPMQRGFTRKQLEILVTLNHLVKTLGRPQAQNQLHSVLKEKGHG